MPPRVSGEEGGKGDRHSDGGAAGANTWRGAMVRGGGRGLEKLLYSASIDTAMSQVLSWGLRRVRNRSSPCFPSPGGLVGALTSKQTQQSSVRNSVRGQEKGLRIDLGAWASRGSGNWPDEVGIAPVRWEFHIGHGFYQGHTRAAPAGCLTE